MNKLIERALVIASQIFRHHRLIMMAVLIAMFVLAAGAPNATIGIGK